MCLEPRPRRITQLFLPPYSPDLNPAERLWHWFREHWSNRTYADEQALVAEAIRDSPHAPAEERSVNPPHQLGRTYGSRMHPCIIAARRADLRPQR